MNHSDIIEYGENLVARDNMPKNLIHALFECLIKFKATIHAEINHTHLIQSSNSGGKIRQQIHNNLTNMSLKF